MQNEIRYTIKIDEILGNNYHLTGRYTITPVTKLQGTPVSPTNDAAVYSRGQQALLTETHVFNPTLINDIRLNYTRSRFSNTTAPEYHAQTGLLHSSAAGELLRDAGEFLRHYDHRRL